MSPETQTASPVENSSIDVSAGLTAGILASVAMAALLYVNARGVLEMAIPALYGLAGPALVTGTVVHLLHGAVFGAVYAAVAGATPIGKWTGSLGSGAGLGLAYGVLVWIVAAAVLMPVWLRAVGFPGAPPLPNFSPTSLVAHVVFGVVLGAAYALGSE